MNYFNIYLENLPDVCNFSLCLLPTISYFASVYFYSMFQKENDKDIDTLSIKRSNKHMISVSLSNIFFSYPLFSYFSNNEELTFYNIIIGMLIMDTCQYFCHYIYHNSSLYILHKEHHKIKSITPNTSFSHGDLAVIEDSLLVVFFLILFNLSFIEFVIITSLSIVSNVSDHTNTSKNKFHYIHHHVNINKNLQAPFFTFWDHILGTYHPNTEIKIPFFP